MKKVVPAILVGLLFSQINCQFQLKKKRLDGLWFYTHTSGMAQSGETEANPASFIYLQPDGNYTRDFNQFDYGRWKRNDSVLLLTNNKRITISFPIKFVSANELELISAKGTILNFELQPTKFSSLADNPFSVENNQWRKPASKKETEQELRSRLKNHFRFHEAYFKWALDEKISSIDVRSTPSPIKIYGNGFALKSFDELPASWRSCFYDAEDCQKANDLIKYIFEKEDIAWARTDNKYKMFISAFQQLEQKIQK
jgi:hypothetical protein